MLTKDDAQAIATKFHAHIVTKNSTHDIAKIFYRGRFVAQFGIRRGSNRNQGHDHIPHGIHWSPNKCKRCAQCHIGFADWVAEMIETGVIAREDG